MDINLELYRVFITVAQQGSFTRAAGALGLTQSAVSQAVRQLEGLLGAHLFIRTAKGATLTGEGQVLMGHVGGLLQGVNTAQRYFTQLQSLEAGSLKIGASDTLCRHVLLDKLKDFHQRWPGVGIQVTNRTSDETVALLRTGAVDIGFVNLPVAGLGDFEVHEVMPLHDCFVCGPRYAADFARPVPLAALARYPLLMLERQSASRRHMDAFFAGKGLALAPQIELGSLDLLSHFAESNLGVAAVVREFVAYKLAPGRLHLVPLEEELPVRSVGMLLRRGVPPSAAVRELMAAMGQT